MLYPIDRETPAEGLEKISRQELDMIAQKVMQSGLNVEVYG
jgi:hypothetical protein